MWFFHHSLHSALVLSFLSLQAPLCLSCFLSCSTLSISMIACQRTDHSHRLPRKQGLKFKAAVVDLVGGKGT